MISTRINPFKQLDEALAKLHQALLIALDRHTLPFYKKLYELTSVYLINAENATHETTVKSYEKQLEHHSIYFLEEGFIGSLIHFYKEIIRFKLAVNRKRLTAVINYTQYHKVIEEEKEFVANKKNIAEIQKQIKKYQAWLEEFEEKFIQANSEVFIKNRCINKMQENLNRQVDDILKRYRAEFKEYKNNHTLKIEVVTRAIENTTNDAIQEEKIHISDVINGSEIVSNTSGNVERLIQEEARLDAALNDEKWKKYIRSVDSVKNDLIRQKNTSDIFKQDEIVPPDVKAAIVRFKIQLKNKKRKWKPVSAAIEAVNMAVDQCNLFAPITDEGDFKKNNKEADDKIEILNHRLDEIQRIKNEIHRMQKKTKELITKTEDKKTLIEYGAQNQFEKIQTEKLIEARARLDYEKNIHLARLKYFKAKLTPNYHFRLPSVKKMLGLGALSGCFGSAAGIAAGFALTAATPLVGWGIAGLVLAGILFVGTGKCLRKAYNRNKKNKILQSFKPADQQILSHTNKLLKQRNVPKGLRHFLKYRGIIVLNGVDNNDAPIECELAAPAKKEGVFYWKSQTSTLLFKPNDSRGKPQMVDVHHFENQFKL